MARLLERSSSCLLQGLTIRCYTNKKGGSGHREAPASSSHRKQRIKIASFEPVRRNNQQSPSQQQPRRQLLQWANDDTQSGNRKGVVRNLSSPPEQRDSFRWEEDLFTVDANPSSPRAASVPVDKSQLQRRDQQLSPPQHGQIATRNNQTSRTLCPPVATSTAAPVSTPGVASTSVPSHHSHNVNNAETSKYTFSPEPALLLRIQPEGRIPKLSYGLERVLFNQGVHWLRDLRTNVYNFDPFLRQLPRPEAFNFDLIPSFTPASRDTCLLEKARTRGCTYVTSTSSISQSMGTIYFVLSRMRPLNLDMLSQPFLDEPHTFTLLTRSPTTVLLRPHGSQLRSIVIEKGTDEPESILAQLGQVMERLLTEPKDNFLKMLRSSPVPPEARPEDVYAYTIAGKVLIRSQLDCHDPRLPYRSFDLKTRAALPIRMDVQNYQKYQEYRLLSTHGLYCSFEREYYDMCRSAFLKYNFQVRIGNMDGIFVAYHNANEIFGFQYVSRDEMDQRLYGNSLTGDQSFNLILQVYNAILDTTVSLYPANSVIRLTFAADKTGSRLTVFSEDCGQAMEEANDADSGLGANIASEEDALPIPAGKNVMQFSVTMSSTVNGFRTEQVLLNPRDCDQWTLSCGISRVPLNGSEYDSVRSRATAQRTPDPDEAGREANFLRIISERSLAAAVAGARTGSLDGEIIAPWTIPPLGKK